MRRGVAAFNSKKVADNGNLFLIMIAAVFIKHPVWLYGIQS